MTKKRSRVEAEYQRWLRNPDAHVRRTTTARCPSCGELPGVEFLRLWMSAPNPMLGNTTPLQMMRAGRGAKLADFIESAIKESPPVEPEPK